MNRCFAICSYTSTLYRTATILAWTAASVASVVTPTIFPRQINLRSARAPTKARRIDQCTNDRHRRTCHHDAFIEVARRGIGIVPTGREDNRALSIHRLIGAVVGAGCVVDLMPIASASNRTVWARTIIPAIDNNESCMVADSDEQSIGCSSR